MVAYGRGRWAVSQKLKLNPVGNKIGETLSTNAVTSGNKIIHTPPLKKKNAFLPVKHLRVHMNSFKRARAFQIELEFGSVGFWGEGKTGVPGEKPLGAKERTNNKLNPHMASTPGFDPGRGECSHHCATLAPLVLQVARTVTEHCMERVGEGKLFFLFFKSVKC